MKILVIAPHPDDETLGCGGTLLRHKFEGHQLYWNIITGISVKDGFPLEKVEKRDNEIELVSQYYGFSDVINFRLPTATIDLMPLSELIEKITSIYKKISPDIIYMPYFNDIHTDHQIISKAVQSTVKWFRYPHIKKVLMYETLSETDFNFSRGNNFSPNVFINISKFLNEKINIMKYYDSEMGEFPFPRSVEAIKALATLRGSQSGYKAAEAFSLLYSRK